MVTFKFTGVARFYVSASHSGAPGHARCGFVPYVSQGEQLDMAQAFTLGAFVVFPRISAPIGSFAAKATQTVQTLQANNPGIRFVALDSKGNATGNGISVDGNGQILGTPLSLQVGTTLQQSWYLSLISGDHLRTDGNELYFECGPKASFKAEKEDVSLLRQQVRIAFDGERRGLLRFGIRVQQRHSLALGIGPRYFNAAAPASALVLTTASIHYPIYDLTGFTSAAASFEAEFDIAAPYERDTLFNDRPRGLLLPSTDTLPSYYATVHGHRLGLRGKAGVVAGFALAPSPKSLKLDGATPKLRDWTHFCTPVGSFEFVPMDDDVRVSSRLMLGLANLENVELRAQRATGGDGLDFADGHAAFDRQSLQSSKGPWGALAGDPYADKFQALSSLDGVASTSWMRCFAGDRGDRTLSLQPEGMQAFAKRADGQTMDFAPALYQTPKDRRYFPSAPILGIGNPGAGGRSAIIFEQEILGRSRRTLLHGLSPVVPSKAPRSMATASELPRTPQGFAIERDSAGRWRRVLFANTEILGKVVGFGIEDTGATENHLEVAFGRNRLCLITTVSTLNKLDLKIGSSLSAGGWTFSNRSPTDEPAATSDPIVIVKYDDRPLSTLLDDPKLWTEPFRFSCDPGAGSVPSQIDALRSRIRVARDAIGAEADLFAPFNRRLVDANWNGVLVLDAQLPLDGMPEQIRGLAAGLPISSELPIHHFGIDITSIELGQTGKPWRSALFGVINYDVRKENPDAQFRTDGVSEIAIWVPKLQLRIENDAVDRFECELQLRIPKIFDTRTLQNNSKEPLVLNGRHELRVVDGRRESIYVLEAEKALTKEFIKDSVIKSVSLDAARFMTRSVSGNTVATRFLIDGNIVFSDLSTSFGLDLFGINELEFSDFGIDLDFSLGNLNGLKFNIKYPSLRFNFDNFNGTSCQNRRRRSGSLFDRMPLKLRAFRFGDLNLPDLGYLPLDLSRSQVPDFKFGFEFDLDLGSLGALAKKLERFKFKLVIGWRSSIADGIAVGFKLDLGEGAGGLDLGVQGILRLTAERFRLSKQDLPQNRSLIVLAADKIVLDVLGVRIPVRDDQRASLFLFGNLDCKYLGARFEKMGWLGSFKDSKPTAPVAIEQIALGQRIDFPEISLPDSTADALTWLDKVTRFEGANADRVFADFVAPGSKLRYAPDREWFVALKGKFFEFLDLGILLRDPDLYGAYIGFEQVLKGFKVDLFYEKLGDGLGKYSTEIALPQDWRTVDVGAAAITIGNIKVELYTDGGFLVDLGFPRHVDYSRSFAVQLGPFLGKGGIYIGRMYGRSVTEVPVAYRDRPVFRFGAALRVGLGREFHKGPISAGLNVSVFGVTEGMLAVPKDTAKFDAYWVHLQGEIGIIAEIEGSVDLKLIRARLVIRVWVATGLILESRKPITLYVEAGVNIVVEVEVGSFRIFGRRIRITVTVSYNTTLRFEWHLPIRMVGGAAEQLALAARANAPPAWRLPSLVELDSAHVAPQPELEVTFNVSRKSDGGKLVPVIVPMVIWPFDPDKHSKDLRNAAPMASLAKLLVAWAALTARGAIDLGAPSGPAMDWVVTAKMLRALDDWLAGIGPDGSRGAEPFDRLPFNVLESFIGNFIKPSVALREPQDNDRRTRADLFPMPPGIALTIDGRTIDYSSDGVVDPGMVAGWMASLGDKNPTVAATAEPLARLLFRNWCELLLRTAIDAATNVLRRVDDAAVIREEKQHTRQPLRQVLDAIDWETLIARVGRSSLSGLRVKHGGGHATLLEVAGLQFDLPTKVQVGASIARSSGVTWLEVAPGPGVKLAAKAAGDDAVQSIDIKAVWKGRLEPTQRQCARRFVLPTWTTVHAVDGAKKQVGILSLFSEALSSALREEWRTVKSPVPLALEAVERSSLEGRVGRIDTASTAVPLPAARISMTIELSIERVEISRKADGSTPKFVPGTYNIAGTNEAQRRWLDDLFEFDQRNPGSLETLLAGAEIRVAWPRSGTPGQVECVDNKRDDVALIRTNLSIERRPYEELAPLATAGTVPRLLEDVFRATPATPREFLYLLRRSAIVNSGGTYLSFPDPAVEKLLEPLFDGETQATKGRASVLVIVTLSRAVIDHPDWGNRSWPGINAMLSSGADSQAIAVKGMVVAYATDRSRLCETVASREPDVSLLRLWRKKPPSVADETPAAVLERQFDMLEFGVYEGAKTLLDVEDCIPIASEEAIANNLPQELKEILLQSKPVGFLDSDFRYDVPLRLTQWLSPNNLGRVNPYAAIGRNFTVRFNWRDLFGNRLSRKTQDVTITPLYVDPLVPPAAWPCIRSRVEPGSAGSSTFIVTFEPDTLALNSIDTNHRDVTANMLERVTDQLLDKNVELSFACGLGVVGGAVPRSSTDELAGKLQALAKHILDAGSPLPAAWTYRVGVAVHAATAAELPILPITLALVIRRTKGDLIDTNATPDVTSIESSLTFAVPAQDTTGRPRESRQDADRKFAEAFRKTFKVGERSFRVARGARLIGEPDLWAVDDVVVKLTVATTAPKRPVAFITPPLSLGPMTISDVKVRDININNSPPTISDVIIPRVVERDIDEMLAGFLERLEEFVGPAIAGRLARLRGDAQGSFDQVMNAKRRLLYEDGSSAAGPLLAEMTSIGVEDLKALEPSWKSALTEFRDACAIDLRRFFGVASVMVWRLNSAASLPPRRTEGEPKLYGRLRVDGAPPDGRKYRLLTRGVDIHATETELAIAVQPEASDRPDAWVELAATGDLVFEITHVERGVRKLSDDHIAQSNWLTLIPMTGADALPLVKLARQGDKAAAAPLPLRRLPKSPQLSRPTSDTFVAQTDAAQPYAARVHQARGWKFGFDLQRVPVPADEVCLRVLYNQPVALGLPTETPAALRRSSVLRALCAFEHEVAQYWHVISPPAGVTVSDDVLSWVCARFSEAIAGVVQALAESQAPLAVELPPNEDRFVVRENIGDKIAIEFTDHIGGDAYWEVVAGEPAGSANLRMPRIDVLRGPAQGELEPAKFSTVTDKRPSGSLTLNYTAKPVSGASKLRLSLGRLDAFSLQTAWLAGSIRRNAALYPPALSALVNPAFIYRTPETLINEVTQPHLRWRETITLSPTSAVPLERAIADLLAPVFAGVDEKYPVQIRADYETGDVVDLIERLAAPGTAFVPEPDPKLMLVGLEMSLNDVASVAQALASDLRAAFKAEPMARRKGKPVGRLVFSVFVQSRASAKDPRGRRPLLRLERIALVLANVVI